MSDHRPKEHKELAIRGLLHDDFYDDGPTLEEKLEGDVENKIDLEEELELKYSPTKKIKPRGSKKTRQWGDYDGY